MSSGRIRDYQGASIVLENHMKFATPARYIQLDPIRIPNQADKSEAYMKWDLCILEASEIFRSEILLLNIQNNTLILHVNCFSLITKTAIVNIVHLMIAVYTLYPCL